MPSARPSKTPGLSGNGIPLLFAVAALCGTLAVSWSACAGDWPQFRGPRRDAISGETDLLREWPAEGPRVLWQVDVADGYAAAAILGDRVYFNDYDEKVSRWIVRCLSLADGKEIWRFGYRRRIRPNHGITRTVPAVDEKYVFSLDPKCVLHCLDAASGKELWKRSFVKDYGARIPPWYAGQCPLIEADRVIVAPAGKDLVVAIDKKTGEKIWATPNPRKWTTSHSSIMPAELCGTKQYLFATLNGVAAVSAQDGRELWHFPRKFNVAMVPSPLAIAGDRVFLTSCYDSGSSMLRVRRSGDRLVAEEEFALSGKGWSSEVQTPIFYRDLLWGVGKRKRGLFTCLDLDGKALWTSERKAAFGLGSFLLADGLFFVLEGKTGTLRLLDAKASEYRELASARVLDGPDAWGPLALSNGKLVVRGWNKMVCLEVGEPGLAGPAQ